MEGALEKLAGTISLVADDFAATGKPDGLDGCVDSCIGFAFGLVGMERTRLEVLSMRRMAYFCLKKKWREARRCRRRVFRVEGKEEVKGQGDRGTCNVWLGVEDAWSGQRRFGRK